MSAAVADYTPARRAAGKIAKQDAPLTLTLERTRDILADLGAHARRAAGRRRRCWWALPPRPTTSCARRATSARASASTPIVANDVSQPDRGFDVDTNAVTIVTADGEEAVPLQSKDGVAAAILDAPNGCCAAPRRRPPPASPSDTPMAQDPLRDHLEYFTELGVDGVHPDALWRARADSAVADGSSDPPERCRGRTSDRPEESMTVSDPIPVSAVRAGGAPTALADHQGRHRPRLQPLQAAHARPQAGGVRRRQPRRRSDVRGRGARAPTKTSRASRSSAAPGSC